jgi:NAD(P)-dependent dehydrogenase (short-subunit alcohol dehydrogenase family)
VPFLRRTIPERRPFTNGFTLPDAPQTRTILPMTDPQVLITGAAGGLGAATTRHLVANGWTVFAADLNPPSPAPGESDRVIPVAMDVTSPDSIARAVATLSEQTTALNGIVHLAGVLEVGSLLEMDEPALRRVFDINFFGCVAVDRAFFPFLKKGRGRIVHVGSETGAQSGAPFNAAYAATKHALDCYSDALRRELRLLDIKVIRLRPGAFRTDMVTSIEKRFDAVQKDSALFRPFLSRMGRLAAAEVHGMGDPVILAKAVRRALCDQNPRPVRWVQADIRRRLLDLLPVVLADRIYANILLQK